MPSPTAADLAAVPFFASLSEKELYAIAPPLMLRSYPKGAVVATAGARLDLFNVILSGRTRQFWRQEGDHKLRLTPEGLGGHFADVTPGGEPIRMSVFPRAVETGGATDGGTIRFLSNSIRFTPATLARRARRTGNDLPRRSRPSSARAVESRRGTEVHRPCRPQLPPPKHCLNHPPHPTPASVPRCCSRSG
ncbi:MAG: hypothetical protein L6Q72_13715 [Burkholderiaceae bacterium]|nr:hypothetical protein [Burkholderiaceae bacterium]